MRRLARSTLNILTLASLLLCIATVVLSVRSFRVEDHLGLRGTWPGTQIIYRSGWFSSQGVIYSGRSVFTAIPVREALRRNEVVGMQIDPWGPSQGAREIDFCGRSAPFQTGPFVIARATRAPLIPVFTVRTGVRRYQMRIAGRFDPRSAADVAAAFEATIRFYERLVREQPAQWLLFDDVWPANRADSDT